MVQGLHRRIIPLYSHKPWCVQVLCFGRKKWVQVTDNHLGGVSYWGFSWAFQVLQRRSLLYPAHRYILDGQPFFGMSYRLSWRSHHVIYRFNPIDFSVALSLVISYWISLSLEILWLNFCQKWFLFHQRRGPPTGRVVLTAAPISFFSATILYYFFQGTWFPPFP